MSFSLLRASAVVGIFLTLSLSSMSSIAAGAEFRTRSAVVAKNGIVATSHPLASVAGLDVLRAGGNAVDAAIAANAALAVAEPMSCGLGGDLFAIVWDAKTQKLYGLNASGRSPYKLTRKVFAEKGLEYIPTEGPLSWSVPGCVSGWEELRKRFGSRSYDDLLRASIDYAENGFPVTELIGGGWRGSVEALSRWPDSRDTFLIDGHAPRVGEVFKNPRMAASLKLIASEGADAFYRGSIARRIVEFSEKNGGYFSMRDFEEHTADWVEPVSTRYRGYELWELPPNGQGIAALQIVNLLEPYDIRALGFGTPEYLHLFVEAKKLAYADRSRYYFDPAFGKPPVAQLISKEYARERGKLIDPAKAAKNVSPGEGLLAHGDTIYVTVVDKDRNCCSLIQSNYYGFGSMVTPGDVGFPIQNRGALFALDENHPNRLEPHRRPFQTIIPAMVTKEGKPYFCYGVMGGDMQPQGHVQVLVNLVDFEMDVQHAGDAPRVRHDGSAEPTGKPGDPQGGTVLVEPGIGDATIDALREKGHRVERRGLGDNFGGYQGIVIDWINGTLHGGSDPRKDGCAIGY